jgi:hypothetical protein
MAGWDQIDASTVLDLKLKQGHGRDTDLASSFCQKNTIDVTKGITRYFPTQFHGKMSFMSNDPRESQDYVVMSHDSNPSKVRFMMEDQWGLKRPDLLISVAGDLNQSNKKLEAAFRRGLVRTATETNAWVIDGAADSGVSAMVGKAVKESYAASVPVIGICAWGMVAHQECLHISERCLTSDGQKVARYRKKKTFCKKQSFGNLSPDPNHTHFIFVDDGETGKYGGEVQFRAKIERAIAQSSLVWHDKGAKIIGAGVEHRLSRRKQQLLADLGDDRWRPANETTNSTCSNSTESRKDIPAVVLCYEGGHDTVDTCFQAVKLGTPVVFIEGSGRCADVFVAAVDHWTKVLSFVAEGSSIHSYRSPSLSYRNLPCATGKELRRAVNDENSDFLEDVEVCRLIAKKEGELATLRTTVEKMEDRDCVVV